MDTVIGLGKAGCAIADKFSQYPQYKIFKIIETINISMQGMYFKSVWSLIDIMPFVMSESRLTSYFARFNLYFFFMNFNQLFYLDDKYRFFGL